MSKIYNAYQKKAGQEIDYGQELAQAGAPRLFPLIMDQQQGEFDQLANRLLGLKNDVHGMVLGFASSDSGEGASFVSYTVATILSQIYNQRVAWLDLNFLSPQALLKETNLPTVAGYLQDEEAISGITQSNSLLVVPGGKDLMTQRGLFAGSNFKKLLLRLSELNDFTVLDLPPVLSSADTALMAKPCDGLLLVVEQRHLKWEVIQHGINSLQDKGVQILGSVINRRKYDLPRVLYDRL